MGNSTIESAIDMESSELDSGGKSSALVASVSFLGADYVVDN